MPVALPDSPAEREALRTAARQELARRQFLRFVTFTNVDYVAEPVHDYVAARLQAFVLACEARESPRLILKMPPQHGKSELSSRRLPGWILGRNPKWRVALMSYSADWARGLAQDARDVVTSDEYRALWSDRELDKSSTAVDDWGFARAGGMIAVGRDGSITGRSAEVLIVDDPVKNQKEADSDAIRDETWKAWPAFRNRVQKGGGVLIVATQWHHDDLIGRLLTWAKEHPAADQYEVINLEALAPEADPLGREPGAPLAPERYDLPDLLQLRASMPERDWLALYCGRPSAEEGAIFRRDWWVHQPVPVQATGWVYLTADTAYSKERGADYTVVQTWRRDPTCWRLLDVYRQRVEFPRLKQDIQLLYARAARDWGDPVALVVEDIGSGKSLIQELKAETALPVLAWKPDRDKVSRAHAVTPLFAAGKVVFPPRDTPWMDAYLTEMERFPVADHDDQVDATVIALTCFTTPPAAASAEPSTHDFTYDAEGAIDPEESDLRAAFSAPLRAEIDRVRREKERHALPVA